jgi:hypothetical protein
LVWNGTIYNITNWDTLIDYNGTIWNISAAWTIITNYNGTIYNSTADVVIDVWDGCRIYNGTGKANLVVSRSNIALALGMGLLFSSFVFIIWRRRRDEND